MVTRATPSFTSFTPTSPEPGTSNGATAVTHYRVERIAAVRGESVASIAAAAPLWRIETTGKLPVPDAPFIGTTGHVVYTDAATRSELARISAGEQRPRAVLIPICKSSAWWGLAQDARQAYLDGTQTSGHVAIGRAHAARVYRRLYHARYLPGSQWDFLTYFEFPEEDTGRFQELLATLRDPAHNPEWAYVEREVEIWMRRVETA
jgi:hypothetical protein